MRHGKKTKKNTESGSSSNASMPSFRPFPRRRLPRNFVWKCKVAFDGRWRRVGAEKNSGRAWKGHGKGTQSQCAVTEAARRQRGRGRAPRRRVDSPSRHIHGIETHTTEEKLGETEPGKGGIAPTQRPPNGSQGFCVGRMRRHSGCVGRRRGRRGAGEHHLPRTGGRGTLRCRTSFENGRGKKRNQTQRDEAFCGRCCQRRP